MEKPSYANNNSSNNELVEKLQEANNYLDYVRETLYLKVDELREHVAPDFFYVKPVYANFNMKISDSYTTLGCLNINGEYLQAPSSVHSLILPEYSLSSYEHGSVVSISDEVSDLSWVEITQGNDVIYVSSIPLMVNITFEDIENMNLNNKIITLNGIDYVVRNLILSNEYNEFETICNYYTGEDVNSIFNMIGVESITDPTFTSEIVGTIGGSSVDNISIYSDEIAHCEIGWRPVLQRYNKVEESDRTFTDILNIVTTLTEIIKRSEK